MENINLIDALSLIIIFISASLAYFRGLSREILAILSWVIAALFAFVIAPFINPLLNRVPLLQEILAESCQLSILISFVLGFILSLVVLSLFVPMITNFIQRSTLSGLDRFLGLFFGIIRGSLILILMLLGYELFFADQEGLKVVDNSRTNEIVFALKEDIKEIIPKTKPEWIMTRFDKLLSGCNEVVLE